MPRKRILLLLAILVLAAAALYVIQKKTKSGSTLDARSTAFATLDTAGIDRIFIAERATSKTYDLKRGKEGWRLRGEIPMAPSLLGNMLKTLSQLTVKRPITKTERNNALEDIAKRSLKIEVYQHGTLAKTIYLGPETDEHRGNYAMLEGFEDPYVVHLPNFMGYPSAAFDVDEWRWRDKTLFASQPSTLREINVVYPTKPQDNLHFFFQNRTVRLDGVENPDTAKMLEYLSHYQRSFVEQYTPEKSTSDSLMRIQPMAVIEVKDIRKSRSNKVNLYAFPGIDVEKDRIMGLLVGPNTAITIQAQNYATLLKKRSDFVKSAL